MNMLQWLQSSVSQRQPGQMPATMKSVSTGVFEVSDRVLITRDDGVVVRGTILEVSIEFPGIFQVIPDYAVITTDTLFVGVDQLRFEGGQTLLATGTDGPSLEASAQTSTVQISPGDTGQVVVTGFGLGLLASVPGVRTIWANQLIPTGVIISGINGDGFNRFVVNWEVPVVPGTVFVFNRSGPQMSAVILAIVIVVGVLAALGLLGWLITKIDVFLNGSPATPPTPWPAGTLAPPASTGIIIVGPDGTVIPPGTPVPPGSYKLGDPPKKGATEPFGAGWIIVGVLALVAVSMFRPRRD